MRIVLSLKRALNKILVFAFLRVKRKKHSGLQLCLISLFFCFVLATCMDPREYSKMFNARMENCKFRKIGIESVWKCLDECSISEEYECFGVNYDEDNLTCELCTEIGHQVQITENWCYYFKDDEV